MKPDFIKVLSDSEIDEIHSSSLRVLEETGVKIQHTGLLKTLKEAGVTVDESTGIAKFPEKIIRAALEKPPKTIPLHSRDDRKPVEIGNGFSRSVSGFDATFLLDHESGKRHPITRAEVGNFAWIAHQLDDIDFVGVQGIPQDVPPVLAEAYAVMALLENTSKHLIVAPDTGRVARIVYTMIEQVTGKKAPFTEPVVSCHISPSAPLRWTPHACEVILETVPRGIPFLVLPAPMAGATSPVTLAGHLIVHNTEMLSGLIIAQILREGAPVVYCNAHTIFSMKKGNPVIATPETMLLRIAGAQMARFYGIPSHSIGFDTDSHAVDQQGAWEKALTAMVCVQAGIDMIVNLGMFSTGLTVSYAQLLLDNEVFGLLRRYQSGIAVSPDHCAVDLIQKIGTWGAYLAEDHTLNHFRSENWYPEITCRILFEPWEKEGSRDAARVAHEKAQELLRHEPPGFIDEPMKRNLEALLEEM